VRLCGELDSRVVAEGIETPTELDAVIAAGARYVQGYLLARPAFPPPDITWPEGVRPSVAAEEPKRPSQRASTQADKKV